MNRIPRALLTVAALCVAVAGCGSASHHAHPAAAISAAQPAAARDQLPPAWVVPGSCDQRLLNWKQTPGAQAVGQGSTIMQKLASDGRAENFTATAAELDNLGALAVTMQGNPAPRCADRHRYWRKITRATEDAASRADGVANQDPASIQQATYYTSRMSTYISAMVRELKRAS
ncbi:MAG: hypothetical protein ACLPUO_14500 [Streptosporangiaceae bacterium]|jgi:hypothetical protein